MGKFKDFVFKYFVWRRCDICGEKHFFLDEIGNYLVCDNELCHQEASEKYKKDLEKFLDRSSMV